MLDACRDFRWRLRLRGTPSSSLLHPHETTHHGPDHAHRRTLWIPPRHTSESTSLQTRCYRTLPTTNIHVTFLLNVCVHERGHVCSPSRCRCGCFSCLCVIVYANLWPCTCACVRVCRVYRQLRMNTRDGVQRSLTSGCSIMWNHSATLILLLTPLIDICARRSTRPKVNALCRRCCRSPCTPPTRYVYMCLVNLWTRFASVKDDR